MEICHGCKDILTVFYHSLPRRQGSFVPVYTSGRAEGSTETQKMKMSVETDEKEHQNLANKTNYDVLRCSMASSGHRAAKATYMCHKGIVDGGLWVTGPARLHCLPLHLGVGCCRRPIVVLEAWAGLLL